MAEEVKQRLSFSIDLRKVVWLLLAVIAGMLMMWRPWEGAGASDRTIDITGEARVTAVPDEFAFYPSYNFNNTDPQAALDAVTKKSEEVVAKLKELGVPESKIKVNSSGYDNKAYPERAEGEARIYNLSLTITVGDKALAQKVQDYLITTNPTGAITPQPSFSEAKRKELEDEARDAATQDARRKADQMAKNLGFRLGKVKAVSIQPDYRILPLGVEASDAVATKSLQLLPGENDLTYTVTVTYYIR